MIFTKDAEDGAAGPLILCPTRILSVLNCTKTWEKTYQVKVLGRTCAILATFFWRAQESTRLCGAISLYELQTIGKMMRANMRKRGHAIYSQKG